MSNINKKLVKIFIFCSSSIFLQVPLSHNLTVSRGSDIITQLTRHSKLRHDSMGKLWHQCGSVKRRKLELLYAVQEAKTYYFFYIVKVLLFIWLYMLKSSNT